MVADFRQELNIRLLGKNFAKNFDEMITKQTKIAEGCIKFELRLVDVICLLLLVFCDRLSCQISFLAIVLVHHYNLLFSEDFV